MDDQELRKLLEQLHTEIEHADTVDEKGRDLLSDVGKDITALLARSEAIPVPPRPTTIQRLEESIEHLEATHPELTTLLSDLLATLSNAGI